MKKILFLLWLLSAPFSLLAQEREVTQLTEQAIKAANEKDWKTAVRLTREVLRHIDDDEVKSQYSCFLAQFLTLQASDEWNANDSVSAFAHSEEAAQLCPGDELVQLHWQLQHYSKSMRIKETASRLKKRI